MAGAIILVIVLLAFPVIVGLTSVILAGAIGETLARDGEKRNEGSELVDLNV
jgi:hypothetical protein